MEKTDKTGGTDKTARADNVDRAGRMEQSGRTGSADSEGSEGSAGSADSAGNEGSADRRDRMNQSGRTGRSTGLVFITGGARSGKSRYAQELALRWSDNPVYVATARHWDGDFQERIRRHQSERDHRWTSIEEEKALGSLDLHGRVVVIDCVTLWLTNFFLDLKQDIEGCLEACKREIDRLSELDATVIIISNEIGMGVHAETEAGRKFTDLQGWMNQYIAGKAGEVVLMVSGIPVTIKSTAATIKSEAKNL